MLGAPSFIVFYILDATAKDLSMKLYAARATERDINFALQHPRQALPPTRPTNSILAVYLEAFGAKFQLLLIYSQLHRTFD